MFNQLFRSGGQTFILGTLWMATAVTPLVFGQDSAKLRTLVGQQHEGKLQKISETEVLISVNGASVTVPTSQVVDLDLQATLAPLPDSKVIDIELIDGTLLHCSQFAIKGKSVEAKMRLGQAVKLELNSIVSILNDAQDSKVREEWRTILAKKGNRDLLAIKNTAGKMNSLEGTLGEGDDKGETIEFESSSGTKRNLNLGRIHALSFVRKGEGDLAAPVCKVYDTERDVLFATRVTFDRADFDVSTVAGLRVRFAAQTISRLDYSQGKLAYLSDLVPGKVIETSNLERVEHYRRDMNLDNGPLEVLRKTDGVSEPQRFAKGLALHPYTELYYDLAGQYKEFKATLGCDPVAGINSAAKVTIEGDGKELFTAETRRKENPIPIKCNVSNVRQLRIVVSSAGVLDIGGHVILGDAKVSK